MDHNGLLKTADEIETVNDMTENEDPYNPVFTDFMQEMINRYRIKRSDISRITGISQDYLYKILSGTKHTAQIDYIIAICCVIGMNARETQHALAINGMQVLNENDPRDRLILDALNDRVTLYRLNDRLEKAGYPWLRFSKDMETYVSDNNE